MLLFLKKDLTQIYDRGRRRSNYVGLIQRVASISKGENPNRTVNFTFKRNYT